MKKNTKTENTNAIVTTESTKTESAGNAYMSLKTAVEKADYIEKAFSAFNFAGGLEFRRYSMNDVIDGRDRLNRNDYVNNMFACTYARLENEKAAVCLKARKTPFTTSNRFSVLEVKPSRGSDITVYCNSEVADIIRANVKVETEKFERKFDLKYVLTVNYSQLAAVVTAVNTAYEKAVKAC